MAYYNPQQAGGVPQASVIHMQPTSVGPPSHTIVVQEAPHYSMTPHYAFSCIVYWCCNWLFGAIAFCVAVSGNGKPAEEAKRFGKISMILNIVGIVITVVAVAIVLGLYFSGTLFQYVYSSSPFTR